MLEVLAKEVVQLLQFPLVVPVHVFLLLTAIDDSKFAGAPVAVPALNVYHDLAFLHMQVQYE